MNNKIILKGKLVTLRPLSLKDAPNFCRWLSDPELTEFLTRWRHFGPPSLSEERNWIKKNKEISHDANFSIDAADGAHIGSVSLKNIDRLDKNAEFGIFIGDKKYWGQGCGTEAGRLIINYGFKKLKLRLIYLRYIAFNIRGEKSYKKLGFKPAGRIRRLLELDGFFHDQCWMDLLKEEFYNTIKR